MLLSFSSLALPWLRALTNLPFLYVTSSTTPSHGLRLMWTLKTLRKMPTRTLGSPRTESRSNSCTSLTLPSAGLTIVARPPSGCAGTGRSGSRKKAHNHSSTGTVSSASHHSVV